MKGFCGKMVEVQSSPIATAMDYALPHEPVCQPPMVHPAFVGMPSSCQQALSAGFAACAEEAERFLIEEENLSPDDPVVVGLREHLRQQQQLYAIQNIFQQLRGLSDLEEEDMDDSGISFDSDDGVADEQTDDNNLQDSVRQSESKTTLDIAAITNIAEEIITLLKYDDSLSDIEEDFEVPEQ